MPASGTDSSYPVIGITRAQATEAVARSSASRYQQAAARMSVAGLIGRVLRMPRWPRLSLIARIFTFFDDTPLTEDAITDDRVFNWRKAMGSVSVTVWDETEGRGPPVVFTHGIFTWATDEEYGFAKQRPLAQRYRMLMMDRRGYGASHDTLRSDFDVDAADIVHLLESLGGAHLVGHANGGLASLLAAAERPDLVHSLAAIQPPTFRAAADSPAVRQLLERVEDVSVPDDVSAEDYLRGSTEGLGMTMPEPTHDRLRAVATSMRERPVWEAEIPTDALRDSTCPKLVISGTWEDAPELYRKYAGEALMECAESVSQAVEAELVRVSGYYPHTQQPERVNTALATLWEGTRHSSAA